MSGIEDELREITLDGDDPVAMFEAVGMIDHAGMRAFGQSYALTTSAGKEEITYKDVGAALVGGVYVGMEYVRRFMDREGRAPWDLPDH